MAKVPNVRGRKSLLPGWQAQTRDLLSKLLKERPIVVDQLAAIDEEIAMLKNALGSPTGAVAAAQSAPAPASPTVKVDVNARGGIAAAVMSALASCEVASVQDIIDKTGLDRGQIYPCLMNLKSQKKIVAAERGSYKLTARGKKAASKGTSAKAAKTKTTKAKKTTTKTKSKTSAGAGSRGPRGSVSGAILKVLGSNPKGVTRPKLIKATGMDERQVSACIMNLKKAGKIKAVARGVYALA